MWVIGFVAVWWVWQWRFEGAFLNGSRWMMLARFFYSVFWGYDSGDVRAWFSYFFDCFVDLRLGFDVFWGGRVCCKDGVLNIREVKYKPTKNLITVLLLLENYLFTSKLAFTQCYLSLKERKVGFRDDISKTC